MIWVDFGSWFQETDIDLQKNKDIYLQDKRYIFSKKKKLYIYKIKQNIFTK